MKKLITKKLNFIKEHPILATLIGFLKGVIFTVLFYEFILK